MSVTSENEGRKWIQSAVAVTCIFLSYVIISFLETLSDWFALESKIPFFEVGVTAFGVLAGLISFILIFKNPKSDSFLKEVYHEVMKVAWPDKDQTWSATIKIMIGVAIMGVVFWFFDLGANFLFNLVNKA